MTPEVLGTIGRDLIRRGESVWYIDTDAGALALRPVGSWDVRGPWRVEDWYYRVDLFGPSGNVTNFVRSAAVLHFRYAIDQARPWVGLSPLQWAAKTGRLAANLELRLGDEASTSSGFLLPIPQDGGDDGDDDPLAGLKADIRNLRGRHALVETTSAGWGEGRSSAPQSDYVPRRLGANPPATLPTLRDGASMSILDACGVPRALAESADGTAAREGWRRFVMGSVEPIARGVADELAAKLDLPGLTFDFRSLWAHDLAGRASSFKALVAGGVNVNEALTISGLLADEAS